MSPHDGEVLEVLFNADDYLLPHHWAAPLCERSRHIPAPMSLPFPVSRRSSIASSISSSLSPLLSPTTPTWATSAWDAARRTAPRPTSTFVPITRGLDEVALFLAGVPGAEERVRRLVAAVCTSVGPVAGQTTQRPAAKGLAVEITETMRIERLREGIAKAQSGKRMRGRTRSSRIRFQLPL